MNSLTSLKTTALVSVTAAATTLLIQACGGGAIAQSASDADSIEGLWDFTITRTDCTTGAALGTQKAMSLFHRGGTFSNDNSTPPATHGVALGGWSRGTGSNYTVKMVFMRFNADGTLAGTQKVERAMAMSADGSAITSAIAVRTLDTAGTVIQQGCGTETGVRMG
jgi:hypothetical protein